MQNIEQEDLDANAQLFQQQPTAPLLQRFRHCETLRLSGEVKPDVIVLLTAPTGDVASFNIQGMTLHSALLLPTSKFSYQLLSQDKLNTLRTKLSNLQLLIIDEVSMVGSNMLLQIHKRLQQLKGKGDETIFGDVSILAVRDLFQLQPHTLVVGWKLELICWTGGEIPSRTCEVCSLFR